MKKPVIDYGWKIPFKYIILFILIVSGIASIILFYRDKNSASYIAEQLSLYKRLNITSIKEYKTEDLNTDLMPGIESKANLYNKDIDTIDNYVGSIEIYSNESYSRIRRTSLKHVNNFITSKYINNKEYYFNRTYSIYLYKNIILKINNNVVNKDEYFDDLKIIMEKITLQNQRTLNARETEKLTNDLNLKLEKVIVKDYKAFEKKKYFYEF